MSTFEKISVEISVVLGGQTMPIHQLLRMGRGAVIELDRQADDDVEILANDIPVARGQVILKGERIGVSITEVLHRSQAMRRPESVKKITA
ncbi:MAG TPA: FliM/FliN family flagellar motor switch protein [Methylomirabilota bacterium]|nr:FliM/FliN family flagellar motor switch protein [Methylomirabilota bacterium]